MNLLSYPLPRGAVSRTACRTGFRTQALSFSRHPAQQHVWRSQVRTIFYIAVWYSYVSGEGRHLSPLDYLR